MRFTRFFAFVVLTLSVHSAIVFGAPGQGDVSGLVWSLANAKTGQSYPIAFKQPGAPITDIQAFAQLDRNLFPGTAQNGLFDRIEFTKATCQGDVFQLDNMGKPIAATQLSFQGTASNVNSQCAVTTGVNTITTPGAVYTGFAAGTYQVSVTAEVKITYAPAANKQPDTRNAVVTGTVVVP